MTDAWPTFLVIYEDSPEDMGLLTCILLHNGCRWDEHRRYEDLRLDIDLDRYRGVVSLGGKGKRKDYNEMEWLRRAVDYENISVLGICQGAQNVAQVLSRKKLRKARPCDQGLIPLHLSDAGKGDMVLGCLPEGQRLCQWHDYTYVLPDNADCLAYSGSNPCDRPEAFRLYGRVYAMQFHPEVPCTEIAKWIRNGERKPSRAECVQIAQTGWNILDAWVKMAISL